MFNTPLDALPPSPGTTNPTLDDIPDPLALAERPLEDLGVAEREPVTLSCADLEHHGVWSRDDCCALCHDFEPVAPEPLHYRHVTVRGCCASHHALNHLHPPHDDFIAKLFG